MFVKLTKLFVCALVASLAGPVTSSIAQKAGQVSEIKIGNVSAYSGPASAFSIIAKTEQAYFRMINDRGGISGRTINFISYDDGYSPPKAMEQTRKLVESDDVLLVFNALGTASNSATQKYLNGKKIPQLFVATPADKWNDPHRFPWTMGFQPSSRGVARVFAKYILENKPDAKVAILYQNDDFGKDYLAGIRDVFGEKASSLIVAESGYEISEPTIDTHIVTLKASGANVFINAGLPKFAAQAIRKAAEIQWKPLQLLSDVSVSIGAVIKPAGIDNAEGIISASYLKDASDEQWKDDAGTRKFLQFIEKYMPGANLADMGIAYGYSAAQTMVHVLEQCGNNLSRDNIRKQAANLRDFSPDMLLPGIKVSTSESDFAPIKQLRMMQFRAGKWNLLDGIASAEIKR
jgi:ABC-type branched-subunit amino acid transport system substrate-binding protein